MPTEYEEIAISYTVSSSNSVTTNLNAPYFPGNSLYYSGYGWWPQGLQFHSPVPFVYIQTSPTTFDYYIFSTFVLETTSDPTQYQSWLSTYVSAPAVPPAIAFDGTNYVGTHLVVGYQPIFWEPIFVSSTLTVRPSNSAATFNLSENSAGTITTPAQSGSINFTDTDATARSSVSAETFVVTATDSHSNTVNLTPAQISVLETEFSYNLPLSNTNNGSINWTYSTQGLNFLASGETVTVTPTLTVEDQNGSQTSTVAVTLHGPTKFLAGFDTAYYPGDATMQWLKSNTNLQWVDYYLTPAPSQANALGWMGNRATLQAQGWVLEPIYVGRQAGIDPSQSGNSLIENQITPTNSAKQQGVIDGDSAAAKMTSEGFAGGTTVYLDIESAGNYVQQDSALQAYISSWSSQIVTDGYSAGVYCRASAASTISLLHPGVTLMIANTLNGPALTANIDETSSGGYVFPEASPLGSNVAKASSWQYAQHYDLVNNANSAIVGLNLTGISDVDLDTMTLTPPALTVASDFNGAGTSDVLLANSVGSAIDWVLQNGSYQSYNSIGSTAGYSIAGTGDFNGDGTADVLLKNSSGAVLDWLMGNGNYAAYNSIGAAPGYSILGTGDFNGDGTSDVLLQDASGNMIDWLMQNGVYSSYNSIGNAAGAGYGFVKTGDFNGDGTSDILLENGSGNVIDWMMNNGTYQSYNNIGSAGGYGIVGTGDFNGDGTTDILLENGSGNVIDWTMKNGVYAGWNEIGNSAGYGIVATGDYNGDGTTDILLENSSRDIIDWTMQNGTFSDWHGVGNALGYAVGKT